MKAVLILDTETTGVDPARDRVVEVGAILWSVEHATRIASYSILVDGPDNPAHRVNGIPPAALADGADVDAVWERLAGWVERVDAIVAHQAAFDRRFVPSGWDAGKPWICTMRDVEWPNHASSKSLVSLALAHGLGVSHAHRALTDCCLIARLLERCVELGFDVEDMLRRGARERARFRALVGIAQKDLVKASGFEWDGERWTREIAVEDANAFPFRTVRI